MALGTPNPFLTTCQRCFSLKVRGEPCPECSQRDFPPRGYRQDRGDRAMMRRVRAGYRRFG